MSHKANIITRIFLLLLVSGCEPIVPSVAIDTWEFEGYTVHSVVPEQPVGIVYLFHGTGGSADFALKIETVDLTNALVERGYGWVATESSQRSGNKRWNVFDSSLATNSDLARLVRLHASLITNTQEVPIFGVGMSNGARMVTLFGQAFADAGYPVVAIAPFNGKAAPSVSAQGGLTVPGFWVTSENDDTVSQAGVIADQQASATMGIPTRLFIKPEEPLLPIRFTRIPGVSGDEAVAIYQALQSTGAWDADGTRQLDIDSILSLVSQLSLPPGLVATPSQIRNQLFALLAVHQFTGLYREQLADFFDERRLAVSEN